MWFVEFFSCQVCSSPDPDIPASAAENQIEQEPPSMEITT